MENRCTFIGGVSFALVLGLSPRVLLAEEPGKAAASQPDSGAMVLDDIQIDAPQVTQNNEIEGVVARQSTAGTKTDADIAEVPQSISVVGRTQMDQQKAQTVAEALKYTPGVFADSRADGLFDGLFIRGFGGFGGLANFSKLLDGLPLQSGQYLATPAVDSYLLDRIDVLKGPSSVLYGQASPGGVVNMVSKRPTDAPLHEVEVQTGSRGREQIATDHSGPIDDQGVWSYRITALTKRADTQIDHTEEQRVAVAPSLTWRPNDDTSLTLLASYQKDPSSYYTGWVPAQGSVSGSATGKISRHFNPGEPSVDAYDREQTLFGYEFSHRFNDTWSFRQNTRYMDLNSEYKGFMVNYVNPYSSTTPGELNRLADHSIEKQQTFSVDNQLEANFDTGPFQHKALIGLEYDRAQSSMRFGRSYDVAGINYVNPVYAQSVALPALTSHTVQKPEQTGLYLKDQIKWDKWTFLAGLRQDWAKTRTEDKVADTHSHQSDQALTGRIGVVYAFDNGISPYASFSNSFEPVVGTDAQGQAFKPTKGEQYEVGIKYQPVGWDSFITLSAFQIKQENVRTTDPDNAFYYLQTGEVRVRGAELEGRANLTDQISLLAGYSILDPEVTKDTTKSNEGNRPVSVPLSQASAWVDYAFRGTFDGLTSGIGLRHIGKSYGDTSNDLSVDAYTLVDAAVRYDLNKASPALKGWSVAVNVNNLNDKHYVASCFSAGGCFYGAERTTLASLKYSW
ncbi:TonB-dependent siderophore receptor [Pseudomonas sp. UBA1879]|uniref:TonB-dependent siderophore receptor n=1 Tax=Pseudomonas sp. UBA1879 TaxID=1947305 RepID=UPI0025CE260B|nr:TonB-dependent siderophore receptor [Pseudomonas sp. UBA1879]